MRKAISLGSVPALLFGLAVANIAEAGPPPVQKECRPLVTRLATPGKISLTGAKGFLLTKSATVKGTLVSDETVCPDGATREMEVDLAVINSANQLIFSDTIDMGRSGVLLYTEGSNTATKFFVPFDSSACNGVPAPGSGVTTEGTLTYVATPRITEAGPDQGNIGTETKVIPVFCKAAR
ncbi:MAG: hypothetical protein JSU66_10755 [Deltaproteobacteria bacterium]|nr:MAG: hypothetical protein JSU66_10755 [Deltaproteobacteria bacterium]